ncbi:ribosome maturation factor RimM [Solirhodobacter olei]|uniref:ribosome maturation factor RimM n=1 Tax=Solirhodobacter olei TaxID=2493082 RepID=UPI000FD99332|nr:ribosome maturation factor RimM [Solirhodobacter olei]
MTEPERIMVGAIAGAFGVQGEVRLKSFCADPEAIASYGPLFTEDGSRSFDVTLTRQIPQGFAARLSGVRGREAAEALKGTALYAGRDALPALGDDEFYHADLIGLTVYDTGGAPVGKVTAVHNHGAGDLLEVTRPGPKGAALLPFTRAIVPTVDLASGRIVADIPEGLIE